MDRKRFMDVVVPMHETLISLARRYTGSEDDARDIVQEVFAKMWILRDRLDGYRNLQALSATITRNMCLNKIKKDKRWRPLTADNIPETQFLHAEVGMEKQEDTEYLLRIVAKLPDLQRTVINMRYLEGMEVEEIARILNCTREAVWMNLSRARKKAWELFHKNNGK